MIDEMLKQRRSSKPRNFVETSNHGNGKTNGNGNGNN
jgi:hypothetical protein